jgi:hypothetical protein
VRDDRDVEVDAGLVDRKHAGVTGVELLEHRVELDAARPPVRHQVPEVRPPRLLVERPRIRADEGDQLLRVPARQVAGDVVRLLQPVPHRGIDLGDGSLLAGLVERRRELGDRIRSGNAHGKQVDDDGPIDGGLPNGVEGVLDVAAVATERRALLLAVLPDLVRGLPAQPVLA